MNCNKMRTKVIPEIYRIFFDKLPLSLENVLPVYDTCKVVTCLNPYYLTTLKQDDYHIYKEFDYICSDGMGPLMLAKIFGLNKSERLSFDMSSMAGPVFNNAITHKKGIYLIGAKPKEIERSVETIRASFPALKILAFHHGYVQGKEEEISEKIISSGAQICIIGMGAPMQDKMAILLKNKGFVGTIYTCGGFIHQTQKEIVSFPSWSNKLGLRWLYRIFTQKGMLKRFLQSIPKFVVTYSIFLISKRRSIAQKD